MFGCYCRHDKSVRTLESKQWIMIRTRCTEANTKAKTGYNDPSFEHDQTTITTTLYIHTDLTE